MWLIVNPEINSTLKDWKAVSRLPLLTYWTLDGDQTATNILLMFLHTSK